MSFFVRYCCFAIILVHIVTSIVAYHFDVDNVILYEDPARSGSRGSYFGYSVALWNPSKRNLNDSWMFIGAPRANSSVYFGVKEPGTVFKCKINKPCREWMENSRTDKRPTEGSWLGGTINIENKSNPQIVVCGPKWTNSEKYRNRRWGTFIPGMCYWAMASDFSNYQKAFGIPSLQYIPAQQNGFSIHMVPDASPLEFVLGSPNPVHLYGAVHRFDNSKRKFDSAVPAFNHMNKIDYSGYAVTSGKYFYNRRRIYAASAPRSTALRGAVDLFSFSYTTNYPYPHLSETGDQIGEYFGAALASCDIDGDGKDDLMVGAPQWTKNFDELGRIYIFRDGVRNPYQFKIKDHFEGKTRRGRFGSAITCLGDIDYDGYADVAVGAPFSENGAVYIFHGSKNGLAHSQTIAGSEDTRGFGFSISEPRDVDNNGYADIAIGACLSGHVILIRSKRVVSTTVNIFSHVSDKGLDREALSFAVSICSSYQGAYATQELEVINELIIDEIYDRAEVQADGEYWKTYKFSETLRLNSPNSCSNFTIKINNDTDFDYFNPLTLSVSQHLDTIVTNSTLVVKSNNVSGNDNFHTSNAVMKGRSPVRVNDRLDIPFQIDCHNKICRSYLSIAMATDLENGTRYVIGSTRPLKLDVEVENSGDNAYNAEASIDIPISIGLINMPVWCSKSPNNETHIKIICKIGNPLAKNKTKNFSINLDMSAVLTDTIGIKFTAVAKTTSENFASSNQTTNNLLIDCSTNADIGITGKTDKDWYSYMRAHEEENMPNIMFQHTYEIRNHEVTPLSEALLSISFPTHWIHADNEIEIIKLNKTFVNLDGQKFDCQNSNETINIRSSSYDATVMPEWLLGENSSRLSPYSEKKFTIIDGKVFSASPDNRTLYINTTNPSVQWRTIDCLIGPFKTAQSTAKIILTLELLLSNLSPEIMQDKDIIFFATNGSTKITVPPNFIQTKNNKPDMVMIGTIFIGSMTQHQVATWVILLSILIGLLLLMLMVFALYKFGFFNRSKRADLEALLKENEDVPPRVVLQTGPSIEDLDTI